MVSFTPRKELAVSNKQEAGRASEPVSTFRRREQCLLLLPVEDITTRHTDNPDLTTTTTTTKHWKV